ncbi:hypothetical protein TYRP_006040 [Tyrophagus putrescentiae]|nr:hypothetical protein TYRP_006040 [Tyrophagus putrescentiae]
MSFQVVVVVAFDQSVMSGSHWLSAGSGGGGGGEQSAVPGPRERRVMRSALVMCLASLGPGRRRRLLRFRWWLCSQQHADAVLFPIRITGHDGHFGRLTTPSSFFAQAHAVALFCEADLASALHSQGDTFAQ